MPIRRRPSAGLTLIELLTVIALMGILAALILPKSTTSLYDQLRATGQVLRTDLAYARSLALTNNSTYRIRFDRSQNQYTLEHSGTKAALDVLPDSPFAAPGDPSDRYVVDLDELPHVGAGTRLVTAYCAGSNPQQVLDVEFGPLGESTQTDPTVIWLAAGADADTRYLSLTVNPVTGLIDVAFHGAEGPPPEMVSP